MFCCNYKNKNTQKKTNKKQSQTQRFGPSYERSLIFVYTYRNAQCHHASSTPALLQIGHGSKRPPEGQSRERLVLLF